MAYYDLEAFISACSGIGMVVIYKQAQEDADKLFKLRTQKEILDFIAGRGLEKLEFINTKPWEKNPEPENVIFVDAYNFNAMNQLGYIAIMKPLENWVIKSFHLSEDRNPSMMLALIKAGLAQGGSNVKR